MGLSWTKKHVATMADVLDQEHESLADAASAALDAALSIIEERGKWAIVGQVRHTAEHGDIPPEHEAAVKVCLGLFDSDTKANDAAGQLVYNTAGDVLRTWVLPMFYGTPAAWHKERRDYFVGLESKAEEKRRAKARALMEKRTVEAQERADAIRAMEEAAGQLWPCYSNRVKQGDCRHEPPCRTIR